MLTENTRIAFIVKPGMDSFVKPLMRKFSYTNPSRLVVVRDKESYPDEVAAAMDWADIAWFDWCDDLLVHATTETIDEFGGSLDCKIVARLHRYEAFEKWPAQMRWENLDALFATNNPFVLEALRKRAPDIDDRVAIHPLLNGVDLDIFKFKHRPRGHKIAVVGFIRRVKNPMLALQAFKTLHDQNDKYHLHFAGVCGDDFLAQYLNYLTPKMGIQANVHFEGRVNDIPVWLEDKSYLMSAAVGEGHPLSVLEAAACGLRPCVHNWPGAESFYPKEWIWETPQGFAEMVLKGTYTPRLYREWVENNHDLNDQVAFIRGILDEVMGEKRAAA